MQLRASFQFKGFIKKKTKQFQELPLGNGCGHTTSHTTNNFYLSLLSSRHSAQCSDGSQLLSSRTAPKWQTHLIQCAQCCSSETMAWALCQPWDHHAEAEQWISPGWAVGGEATRLGVSACLPIRATARKNRC